MVQLNDASLLREALAVAGGWLGVTADALEVHNPAEVARYGIDEFPEIKYLCMGGIEAEAAE